MIRASSNSARLAAALVEKAQSLAAARVQDRALSRRDPALRWRRPELLWPLFTKD